MENRSLPSLETVTNFRELGGLPAHGNREVRHRRLFRSGHWGAANDADREHMGALGIRIVFDFRSDEDIEIEGADRLPPGTELVRLAASDPAGALDLRSLIMESAPEALHEHFGEGRAAEKMCQGAARLVSERCAVYSEFVQRLAEPNAPAALFHCSAGKDRAGWAASVLLLALGVAEPEVREHYLLSNVHYQPRAQQGMRRELSAEVGALLQPLLRVAPEYIGASLDAVTEHFGSVEAYLRDGLGLSELMQKQLHENWLA
jgi:protein-tyrosine phosphatase